ncbi:helix-turn-helix domain-containing protein [Actinomadura scrupuli]|uniref:helix-turn-helix domain-containing protein n=1 Tax=Actinomadura scrupuli TaxID=559629 RepID=UPI003D986603
MASQASLKREIARLRDDLRAQGGTWREIASVIGARHRVNARVAFRLAHGWTQREVAARYNERWPDERPKTFKHVSYWENWSLDAAPCASARTPSYQDLDRLARLYECSVADLLDGADHSALDANFRARALVPPLPVTHDGRDVPYGRAREGGDPTNRRDALRLSLAAAVTPYALERVLGDAAAEAMEFTRQTGVTGVGSGALEHLEAVVTDLDRCYYRAPLAEQFAVARAYRQRVQELIQGRHTLKEGRRLYVYAAWLDEAMTWLALNLGDRRAAKAYALDCFEHADQAGHAELRALAVEAQAVSAQYDNDPRTALLAIQRGIALTPASHPMAVRLRATAACVHAQLGQPEPTEEMIRQGERLCDRLPTRVSLRFTEDDSTDLRARLHDYAARSHLRLENFVKAEDYARCALSVHESGPAAEVAPGKGAGNRMNLGIALTRLGAPEEAAALGRQALGSASRFQTVRLRARELDDALTGRYARLPEVREFHEHYRELTRAPS